MKEKYHLAAKFGYYSYLLGKEDSEVLMQLAAVEMKVERHASAIKYLEEYIELNKDPIKARLLLGIVYRQKGDFESAIKTHLKCLKKGEEDVIVLYTLGLDYEKAKKIRTAKRYYAQVIETERSFAKAYFRLAHLYLQEKKYDLAVNLYLDGLSLREGTAKDWINLSLCYLMTSNLKAAEKVLLEALEIFPKSSEVLFALGTCYIKKSDFKKCATVIDKLEERAEDELVLSLRIKETLDRKQFELLGELLDHLGRNEKTGQYWYMKAVVEANTGNEKRAIDYLRKAVNYDLNLRKEALKDDNFSLIRELVEFKHVVYQRK